jgi:hypothetical protein
MLRTDRSQTAMGCDLFLRPAVNTSVWAWGPHPCGPQSQKEITTHGGRTAGVSFLDSNESDPIFDPFGLDYGF